ncbi:MAG: hypothetical protein RIG77_08055 [Cyclobacteriaceae bacterium]
MNKYLRRHSIWALPCIGLLVFACNVGDINFENIEDPTLKPEVVAPIGEVTYTINELIEEINDQNIIVKEGKNLLVSILYRDTSRYQTPDEMIKINDISQQKVVEPGITVIATPVERSEPFSETFSLEYPAENEEGIDSILYSGGNIEVVINSQIQADVDLEIKLVDFVHSTTRDTIVFNSSLPYTGTLPVSDTQSSPLAEHRSKFNRIDPQNFFSVVVTGTINLKPGQSVDNTDIIVITVNTHNTTFSSVIGYFGEDEIVVQDQVIDIGFFTDIEPLGLEFEGPEIIVNVANSFGLPLGLSVAGLTSSNENGDFRMLTGDITAAPSKLRAPTLSQFGKTLNSSVVISNENSNLRELLSISPNKLTVPITATTNYENVNEDRNFYRDDSEVVTMVEVNMPFSVKLDGFSQTFNFNIDPVDFDEADSLKLRVKTVNDLPFNGSMSMFLLNEDSVVIHELPEQIILESPEVGSDGRSVETKTSVNDILLNSDGVKAIPDTRKIAIVLKVDSFEAQDDRFVQIFSDYALVIKLGIIANLNVTP